MRQCNDKVEKRYKKVMQKRKYAVWQERNYVIYEIREERKI